ncbi:sugar phosphate isomerase/epimerase family protein [Marinoscillum furvescens]|uniref:Sugar phosphate isomerase/epimerase n=1 Tax=Marinoscillum furvescens DSM 4134 TaxID=1122208 RepID=A0A3D9KZ72_MARFU|nr:sugar phosphate isomerase/epimerase [Marinoscillum furvescens]RED93399.1 sugar phosphate isomerase/epimerase [Marinoscillum furvescens DSM 4134]
MYKERRKFIKTSAVASAAVLLMPSCVTKTGKEAATAAIAGEQPQIGLGLYTVRNQMAQDPKGTLEKIAEIGYKKIEPFGFDGEKVFGMTAKEFKQIADDLGLQVVSGHIDPSVFQNKFEASLDFFAEVGQQYAVWPYQPADQRSLDDYKMIAETLSSCAEQAKKVGVNVCYHNHDFEYELVDGEVPLYLLRDQTDKAVQFELDLYWVTKAGKKPVEEFKKFDGRVPLWHVKDMANTEQRGFAEVGEGIIDYKEVFANKELSGMKHFFVEQDQSADPMKSIEISFKNLTEKILA